MLYIIILVYVVSVFHNTYGKSHFRACSEENPCDKDFYCNTFVRFCSPCRDICNKEFSRYCQLYCADSEYIKNIDTTHSTASILIGKALSISDNYRQVDGYQIHSTTPIIRDTSVNTIDIYQVNEGFESETYWFGYGDLLVLSIILFLVVLLAVLLWRLLRRSDFKHGPNNNCYSKKSMDIKTAFGSAHPRSGKSNSERSNDEPPNKTGDSSLNVKAKCTCHDEDSSLLLNKSCKEVSVRAQDSGIYTD